MELFQVMRERRSCRNFLPDPINRDLIDQILEAATWAPSPLNMQPWEFIVVTDDEMKRQIFSEAERCRQWALEKSGWKWLGGYGVSFLLSAPVIIAVVGDPKKTGVDQFQEEGHMGYQHACAAAMQNMHLAAHALGLSSLWFTFFDKKVLRQLLDIDSGRTPIGLVCIGKAGEPIPPTPRKGFEKKTRYIG